MAAEKAQTCTNPRVPQARSDHNRPQSFAPPPPQGPQTPFRLINAQTRQADACRTRSTPPGRRSAVRRRLLFTFGDAAPGENTLAGSVCCLEKSLSARGRTQSHQAQSPCSALKRTFEIETAARARVHCAERSGGGLFLRDSRRRATSDHSRRVRRHHHMRNRQYGIQSLA